MSAAAIAACRDYEHWAREVVRLTSEIAALRCPNERDADFPREPEPSCFREASEDEIGGGYYDRYREDEIVPGRRLTLDEIAERVADCPECSRLVVLIRERRQARRKFGAAKRAVRRVGRALLAAEQPA